jgi:hypothetical protein
MTVRCNCLLGLGSYSLNDQIRTEKMKHLRTVRFDLDATSNSTSVDCDRCTLTDERLEEATLVFQ